MMKKVFAWVLCLAMLLSTAAFAENEAKEYSGELTVPERFAIQWVAPLDYELKILDAGNPEMTGDSGFMLAALIPTEAESDKPVMTVSIARDELLTNVDRLNDLDDEALAKIESTFRDEDTVDISYMETTHGTKLMVVKEAADGINYVDFYTIYMGYGIEMVLTQSEAQADVPLTDEQIAMVVQFLSDLEFVPLGNEDSAIVCSIENGSYVISIPVDGDDQGWYADETAEGAAVKLGEAKLENGRFVVRFDPASDGEATVSVRHFYTAAACDQAHTWNLVVKDGTVQEANAGSYTANSDEQEIDPYLSGKWTEKDTQFTEMVITKNEARGWDVEIVSPLTHGAYKFVATICQDCYQDAFVYEKGKFFDLPVDGSEELGEATEAGAVGCFKFVEDAGSLSLVWIKADAPDETIVFERVTGE